MDIFFIKKLAGVLLMPLPIAIFAITLGFIALLRHNKTSGTILSSFGIILLLLFSTPFLPNKLLYPLERQFNQFDMSHKVNTVVVLGCSHINDGSIPITAQISSCSISRLIEGIRIHRANPGSKIITSGWGNKEPFANAEMNKRLAIALGVKEQNIIIEPRPRDTEQEAEFLAPRLAGKYFALVTSASHMPRAMHIFEAQALTPIAAPTGHLARDESRNPNWLEFPDSRHLNKAEVLWYETMGRIYLQLKTWLS